jgi:parallel beta-helix repeat protein
MDSRARSASRRAFLAIAALGICCLLPAQATATHVQCGDTITHDTTLDFDLIDCPGAGIVIGAPELTLELNGHTVDGTQGKALGVGGSPGIDNGEGHDGVEIRGPGVVRDFEVGVWLLNAGDNVVHRLEASANLHGIFLAGPSGSRDMVARNVVSDNVFSGIALADECVNNIAAGNNRIERNTAFQNSHGIVLTGCADGNLISRNTPFENGVGILLSDSFGHAEIAENNVFRNAGSGIGSIELQKARIERNRVTENGRDGIEIDDHNNLIQENVASRNALNGITVPHDNTVTRNSADENGGFGIEAQPGVIDGGGNRASGNGNPLQCLYVDCKINGKK